MRRLFMPGYYCGFSNNKMSLDIAVVLAYLTGRVLVPYRFRLPRRLPMDVESDRVYEPLVLPDLFEIPVTWSDEHLLKTWISAPDALELAWRPVHESLLCFPSTLPHEDGRFEDFRNGRTYVYTLGKEEEAVPDLHITTTALGFYSYFFYLDDQRRLEVVDLMRRLRPKRPYREAAASIARSLGRFNAIHLRRGDFVTNDLARMGISRAATIGGGEIVDNLATRMDRDDLLVICTDGHPDEEIFAPLRDYFREVIFLDHYLSQTASIRELISQLPHDDESAQVLLTQLVASQAQIFAGTLFSTFTALIHRQRSFDRQESSFLYCYGDFPSPAVHFDRCEYLSVADGPYSWNRLGFPVSPDAFSWLREWPECSNSALPASVT